MTGRRRSARPRGSRLRSLAVAWSLGLMLAACGQAGSAPPTGAPQPSPSPSLSSPSPVAPSPAPSYPASPVDGVIIAVDASSLTDVRGFTLLTPDGRQIGFRLGTLENPTDFPPGHLAEHQATSEPIRVYFRIEDGVPVVYRLGDAPEPASPAAT